MQRSPGDLRDQLHDAAQSNKNVNDLKTGAQTLNPQDVTRILLIIIHLQDLQKTVRALEKLGVTVIRLASSGAFLGRQNATLLMPLTEMLEEQAMHIVQATCRQRIEYISTPLEGAPMPLPLSTPVHVGGASIFTLPVERYEEI